MASTQIDDDDSPDEEAPEVGAWLQVDDPEPIPTGDARRRLERYWELKRLREEVDDFSAADLDWDEL